MRCNAMDKKTTIDFTLPQSFPSPGIQITAEQQQQLQNSLSPAPPPDLDANLPR